MSERIKTVLIIGGTSGIGEAFARRFHSLGKKVIVKGRNQEKLKTLSQDLSGLEARELVIDNVTAIGLDGSVKQEIGVGYGAMGVDTWRASFGAIYEGMGVRT